MYIHSQVLVTHHKHECTYRVLHTQLDLVRKLLCLQCYYNIKHNVPYRTTYFQSVTLVYAIPKKGNNLLEISKAYENWSRNTQSTKREWSE